MSSRRQTIVFADAEALPAGGLEALARQGSPLVLCSSQSRAELEMRHQELGIRHPFVSENGSAAFVPQHYFDFEIPGTRPIASYDVIEFGKPLDEVSRELHRVATALRVEIMSFSRMSVDEVAEDCQLSLLRARLAKLREYQDVFRPVVPLVSVRAQLRKALRLARLVCIDRGRYDHVGHAGNASRTVAALSRLFRRACGAIFTVGIAEDVPHAWFRPPVDCYIRVPRGTSESGSNAAEWVDRLLDRLQKLEKTAFAQSAF
jgi:predicted mannosyl-3-phosphoglycerate phosphatase (HAD superfamily)